MQVLSTRRVSSEELRSLREVSPDHQLMVTAGAQICQLALHDTSDTPRGGIVAVPVYIAKLETLEKPLYYSPVELLRVLEATTKVRRRLQAASVLQLAPVSAL